MIYALMLLPWSVLLLTAVVFSKSRRKVKDTTLDG